ncbi:conserved uncharacterized protein [Erwinia billingiae Eb661]|uniref:Conserved uncharacterized protein n=1 Tax=Erwinia billingiae (strain Eb661) TaxID=634500 RepID=D8MP75_ERWBE|nr:DUF4435 domain-containing protein [Erwinia billingiae]CAX58632.1 conserved uncharacterized protein [Erwinia billingiae Eb661]
MDDFDTIRSSRNFLNTYNVFTTSEPAGFLYVEDASDRLFWEGLVKSVCPGRYRVMPYSQGGAEAKRSLEREYVNLHQDFIVGVDSDYDYLCSNRNEFAEKLSTTKYVLHTFYYSRESHINSSEAINHILECFHLHTYPENQLQLSLEKYADTIYPALSLFSWLHNNEPQAHPENLFNIVTHLPDGHRLLNADLTVNENTIIEVKKKVDEYIHTYNKQINDNENYNSHLELLLQRGINKHNAHLFINGHYLLEGILLPILKMVVMAGQNQDKAWVEQNYEGEAIGQRKRQVVNHYKENCNTSTLVFQCTAYHSGFFWQRIAEKMRIIIGMP